MTTDRLRALLAEATPGPWHQTDNSVWAENGNAVTAPWMEMADAALIVAAVNALPALVEVVEAAREVAETPWYPGGHPVSSEDMDPLRAALAKLDEAEQ